MNEDKKHETGETQPSPDGRSPQAGGGQAHQTPGQQVPRYRAPGYQNPGPQTSGQQTPSYQVPGYQTPGYHPPESVPAPYSTPKPKKPTLSSVISLAAVGAMLVIAAVGLWVMLSAFANSDATTAGRAILISTGLIVFITGAVLGRAAWKGERPGWFLWFSIAGAFLLGPVTLGGIGILANGEFYDDYASGAAWEEEMGFDGDNSGRFGSKHPGFPIDPAEVSPDYWERFEDHYTTLFEGERATPLTWLNPEEGKINLEDESAVLDLTGVEVGKNAEYEIDLNDSDLRIVLTRNQLPVIESLYESEEFSTDAYAFVSILEYPEVSGSLANWLFEGFDEGDFPLLGSVKDASNQFTFFIDSDDSFVEFIVVEDGTVLEAADKDTDQRSQAGTSDSGNETSSEPSKDDTK